MTLIKFLNQLKPVKQCIGCKFWFVKGAKTMESDISARCRRVLKSANDNNDDNRYEYAYIARSDNEMCGPKGLKFEPIIRVLN